MKIKRRTLGLDIGTNRIGVAIADELGMIASPVTTIIVARAPDGEERAVAEIVGLVHRFDIGQVVAGLPRNMKGERGVQAVWTEHFVAALRAALNPEGIYVTLQDERLTTVQAERSLRDESRSRRQNREREGRHSVDARAAALILQAYLDRRRIRP